MSRLLSDHDVRLRASARRALRGEPSGMTLDEARAFLRKLGWDDKRMAYEERIRRN